MKYVFGTMIAVGFVMVLGAAGNDCDGKCMETANTIGEMLTIAGIGLSMMLFGAMVLISNRGEA